MSIELSEYEHHFKKKRDTLNSGLSVPEGSEGGESLELESELSAYESYFKGKKESQKNKVKNSISISQDKDSSRMVDAYNISKEKKLPVYAVERNLDKIKKKQKENSLNYDSLVEQSPGLAKWLSKPENASIAKDEIEPLKKIEQSAISIKPNKSEMGLFSSMGHASSYGFERLKTSSAILASAYGLADPESLADFIVESQKNIEKAEQTKPEYAKEFDEASQEELKDIDESFSQFTSSFKSAQDMEILKALKDFSVGGTKTVAETLDLLTETIVKRPKGTLYSTVQNLVNSFPSLLTGMAGAKAGAIGGTIVPGVGTVTGGAVGFGLGSFVGSLPVEVGASVIEDLQKKGIDLKDRESVIKVLRDPEYMRGVLDRAERKGLGTATVDGLFNMIGGKFLAGAKGGSLVSKLKAGAKDIAIDATGEGAGEFAGQVAREQGDLSKVSMGESVLEGIISLGSSSGDVAVGALNRIRESLPESTPDAAREGVKQAQNALQSLKESEALESMVGAMSEASNTAQANGAIKELIQNSLGTQEEASAVFMQVDDFDSYWSDRGESPLKKAYEISEETGQSYAQARLSNGDLEIALEDFAEKVSKDKDAYEGMLSKLRTRADGLTREQATEVVKAMPEVLKKLSEEAERADDPDFQADIKEVKRRVVDQLRLAGFKARDAEAQAQLYEARIRNRALLRGESPLDIFREENFSIEREGQEVIRTNETYDTIMKRRERRNQIFKDKNVTPKSIDELTGEMRQMAEELIDDEISSMIYEIEQAEPGQRSGFERVESDPQSGGGEKVSVNTSTKSTFPEWYKGIGAKNKEDFRIKALSKKGAVYQRIRELAIERLNNGYESDASGRVMPDNTFRAAQGLPAITEEGTSLSDDDFDLFQGKKTKPFLLREGETEQTFSETNIPSEVTKASIEKKDARGIRAQPATLKTDLNKKFAGKEVFNKHTSFSLEVTPESINNAVDFINNVSDQVTNSKRRKSKERGSILFEGLYNGINNIDKVFENALYIAKDKEQNPIFFSIYNVGGRDYLAKFKARATSKNKAIIEEIKLVKSLEAGAVTGTGQAKLASRGHEPTSNISIEQFKNHINSTRNRLTFFQGKQDLTAQEDMANETPTPMELYQKRQLSEALNLEKVIEESLSFNQASDLGFYSKLKSEVSRMDFKSIPAKDLANRIKNIPGIKKDELEQTGILDLLEVTKGKVTKEEIVSYLDTNGLQLEEIVKGDSLEGGIEKETYTTYMVYNDGMQVGGYGNQETAEEVARDIGGTVQEEVNTYEIPSEPEDATKYSDYTMPGGDNYREVLLRLPISSKEKQRRNARLEELKAKSNGNIDNLTDSEYDEYQKAMEFTGSDGEQFYSGHWDEGNVLAFFRLKDRIDTKGNKTLFVEEIQSDWHQEGRKRGYAKKTEPLTQLPNGYKVEEGKPPLVFGEGEGQSKTIFRVFDSEGLQVSSAPSKDQAVEAALRKINREATEGKVPDAPFKNTEAWSLLAFKRILRMAAENGYDSVSWTPGEVQSERYDLSNQVDSVGAFKKDDGTYDIEVMRDDRIVSEQNLNESELEANLGKDLAEKIIKQTGREEPSGYRVYEGLDLKVGGEGMKAFYDKMLPKAIGKYIKKLDKTAKVGITSVEAPLVGKDPSVVRLGDGWYVSDLQEETQAGPFRTRDEAIEAGKAKTQDVWYVPITDKAKEKILIGQEFFQKDNTYNKTEGDENRGRISIKREGGRLSQAKIELFSKADPSTFLHESGHLFLEEMREDFLFISQIPEGTRTQAQKNFLEDISKVEKYLGKDIKSIGTDEHELWARTFEKYLMEGNAPTQGLQRVFNKFRVWLTSVYRKIKNIDAPITNDIREVMDRMLVAEDEIDFALRDQGIKSILSPSIEDKISRKTRRAYEDLRDLMTEESKEKMARQMAENLKKEKELYLSEEGKRVRKEVENELKETRAYRTLETLKNGKTPDNQSIKLDRNELVDIYGESILNEIPEYSYKKGGLLSETVKGITGHETLKDLIDELKNTKPLKEQVKLISEKRLQEKRKDLFLNDEKVDELAQKFIHSDKRAELLRMELSMLSEAENSVLGEGTRKTLRRVPSNDLLKREAINLLGKKKVRDIRPHVYQQAEVREARKTEEHISKSEWDQAFKAKERELLNHELYRTAKKMKEDHAKALKRFKNLNKSDDKLSKSRDMAFINAARSILSKYNLVTKPGEVEAKLDRIRDYSPQVFETISGIIDSVKIPAKDYKELTQSEFQEIDDTFKALWELSKSSKEVEIDGQKKDISEVVEMLKEKMQPFLETKSKPKEQYARAKTKFELTYDGLLSIKARARRLEHWVEAMDLGDYGGLFRKVFFQDVSDATDQYYQAKTEYTERLVNMAKELDVDVNKKIISDELAYEFQNKGEVLGAILHIGNESNKKKLLVGRGWGSLNEDGTLNTQKWDKFLNRMFDEGVVTKKDMDFIQGLWDLMEEIKPQAQKAHMEVFGYHFDEITTQEFETPFGKYRGGYAPAKVDYSIVKDALRREELKEFTENNPEYAFPGSGGNGFAKSRVENYNKPLSLDINLVTRHIDDVLRFAIVKPKVVNAAKIATNPEFREAMDELDPTIIDGMIKPALQRADTNRRSDVNPDTPVLWKKGGSYLKKAMSANIMFMNVVNTLEQFTGLIFSTTKMSPKAVFEGAMIYLKNPKAVKAEIESKSQYMKVKTDDKMFEFQKKANELFQDKTLYGRAKDWADKNTYIAQIFTQDFIDNMVWISAYNDAIANGQTDKVAIQKADSVIRTTQNASRPLDIAQFQSNGLLNVVQMFMGYFNMVANANVTNFHNLYYSDLSMKDKFKRGIHLYTAGYASLAVLSAALRKAAAGGLDEDEDWDIADDLYEVVIRSQLDFGLAMLPLLGQAINAGINRGDDKFYNNRMSASPVFEGISTATDYVIPDLFSDREAFEKANVRDGLTALGIFTGLPLRPLSKPYEYVKAIREGEAKPKGPIDFTRGIITGKKGVE
jgi:hypothetical protein